MNPRKENRGTGAAKGEPKVEWPEPKQEQEDDPDPVHANEKRMPNKRSSSDSSDDDSMVEGRGCEDRSSIGIVRVFPFTVRAIS